MNDLENYEYKMPPYDYSQVNFIVQNCKSLLMSVECVLIRPYIRLHLSPSNLYI